MSPRAAPAGAQPVDRGPTFPIQPSFARGVISPRLRARVDVDHYRVALADAQNFYVMRQGGIRRRPGTRFVAQGKWSRLIVLRPFVFTVDQVYLFEFGDRYMRFHTAAGTVMDGNLPYEIVSPWALNHLRELQFEQTADVIRVTHRAYAPRTIRRYDELDWRILPVVFDDGPYQEIIADGTVLHPSSNGGVIQGVTGATTAGLGVASASSEYSGGSFPAWQAFDANGNTEWMAGDGTTAGEWLQFLFDDPKVVTGYVLASSPREDTFEEDSVIYKVPGSLRAPRSWSFEASVDGSAPWVTLDQQAGVTGWGEGERRYFTFQNLVAYRAYRLRITDINSSTSIQRPVSIGSLKLATGGPDIGLLTLTISDVAPVNGGAGFKAGDVGRHIRLLSEDAYWHWFKILTVVSDVAVDVEMYSPPLPSTNGSTTWRLGAFGDVPGWPARIGLYQDRVFYARTDDQPQTVWGSRTDDYDSFATSIPAKADDAVSFTIAAAGEIAWMMETDSLLIGTATATRSMGAANPNEGFSATNFKQGVPLRTGSAAISPAVAGVAALFVGRLGTTLHELTFSFDVNSLIAPDVAVLSEHLLRAGIVELAYAFQPNAVVWMVMKDGSLVSMTYEREQKMVALMPHTLGGGGLVESVTVLPGANRDEVYFSVNRDGVRTIELLAPDFESGDEPGTALYSDCGVAYVGDPATTVTNLPAFMIGKEVAILADGAVEPRAVVGADRSIALPSGTPASRIKIGFPYRSMAQTLRLTAQDGAGLGSKKILKKIYVDLLDAGDLRVAAINSSSDPQQLILRSTDDGMGDAIPLVTGAREVRVDDRWTNGGQVVLTVEDPVPCTILALTPGYESEP